MPAPTNCKILNYITFIFQKFVKKKDIRFFKNNLIYYLFFRICRKFLNHDIIVNIFNFKVYASYKKNKTSHALLRKCGFDDVTELNIINKISQSKEILFLDCGSNYGFYSLYAASLNNKNFVIGFEASLNTCEAYKKNIELNNFKNVDLIQCALSNENNESLEFFESENDWESSISHENFNLKAKKKVLTKTLDHVLKNKEFEGKNLIIKLDIEGNEFKALEGASKTIEDYSPVLIIELSRFIFENYNNRNYLSNFLMKYNYLIYNNKKKQLTESDILDLIKQLDKSHNTIGNFYLIKKDSDNEKIFLKNE